MEWVVSCRVGWDNSQSKPERFTEHTEVVEANSRKEAIHKVIQSFRKKRSYNIRNINAKPINK